MKGREDYISRRRSYHITIGLSDGKISSSEKELANYQLRLFGSGADKVMLEGPTPDADFIYRKCEDSSRQENGKPVRCMHYICENWEEADKGFQQTHKKP